MPTAKINLLYVLHDLRSGGAERQFIVLLRNLDRNKFRPHVACLNKGGQFQSEVEEMGLKVDYVERLWRWDISPIFKLYRLIRRYNINIVHSYLFLPTFYSAIAAKLSGVSIVNSSFRKSSSIGKVRDKIDKLIARISSIVIVNSYAGKRFLAGIGKTAKVRVIHNGIDTTHFDNSGNVEEIKKSFELERFETVVSMIANLEPRKDPFLYLRSAKNLFEKFPLSAFLLVGGGSLLAKVKEITENEPALSNVYVLGHQENVADILKITDVFVHLSAPAHSEGIPNSIMEAMALGKPVVATDSGGCDELVEQGRTGYLIKSSDVEALVDKISQLLEDTVLRQSFGKAGTERIRADFSMESYVLATSEIYSSLISQEHGES